MHRRHHRRHFRGEGCGPGLHRRVHDREAWLRQLEEYQKDLEQEVADVADLIRRLRDEKPAETATV